MRSSFSFSPARSQARRVSAQAAGQSWPFFEIYFGKGAPPGELPDGNPAKHTSKYAACVAAAPAARSTAALA
jgi:hypothetical protein